MSRGLITEYYNFSSLNYAPSNLSSTHFNYHSISMNNVKPTIIPCDPMSIATATEEMVKPSPTTTQISSNLHYITTQHYSVLSLESSSFLWTQTNGKGNIINSLDSADGDLVDSSLVEILQSDISLPTSFNDNYISVISTQSSIGLVSLSNTPSNLVFSRILLSVSHTATVASTHLFITPDASVISKEVRGDNKSLPDMTYLITLEKITINKVRI